ncbi:MAG: sensor histidine kinase, partial [Planctomycetota bacterium]
LNQPLTAIVNYAEAARASMRSAGDYVGELRDDLARIVEQAERAAAMVSSVRMFVRKQQGSRKPADVNAVIDEILPFIAAAARPGGVQLSFEKGESLPSVTIDAIQIQQVVLNLARNGIEAMAGGPEPRVLTLRTEENGSGVEVSVHNTGPPIDKEAAGHLFEPFYSTRPDGMGLGLAMGRSIIESHQGTLEIADNAASGVAFRFTLPRSSPGDADE